MAMYCPRSKLVTDMQSSSSARVPDLEPVHAKVRSWHNPVALATGRPVAYWGSSAFLLVFCVSQPFSENSSVPEQLTLNQRVAGSSPAAPTIKSITYTIFRK